MSGKLNLFFHLRVPIDVMVGTMTSITHPSRLSLHSILFLLVSMYHNTRAYEPAAAPSGGYGGEVTSSAREEAQAAGTE